MVKKLLPILVPFLAVLLLVSRLGLFNFGSGDGSFLVKRVVDGDTIVLDNGERVRYIGVDTPETVQPGRPVECYGREASRKNKELVEGKRVRLEQDVSHSDRFGRLLRYVYIGNIFVNEELVRNGYATADRYPPDIKYQDSFAALQEEAKRGNLGLWGACERR
ncbi:MAG: hypothetical protein EXR50_04865 [Dehalococcoidia bacterium]|nr:hypothetical protein [Dehalococcoidia bacterium]